MSQEQMVMMPPEYACENEAAPAQMSGMQQAAAGEQPAGNYIYQAPAQPSGNGSGESGGGCEDSESCADTGGSAQEQGYAYAQPQAQMAARPAPQAAPQFAQAPQAAPQQYAQQPQQQAVQAPTQMMGQAGGQMLQMGSPYQPQQQRPVMQQPVMQPRPAMQQPVMQQPVMQQPVMQAQATAAPQGYSFPFPPMGPAGPAAQAGQMHPGYAAYPGQPAFDAYAMQQAAYAAAAGMGGQADMGQTAPSSHGEGGCSCGSSAKTGGPHSPNDPKHLENKYGQLYGMISDAANGNPDISKFLNFFSSTSSEFWKGALVGAGLTLLLTNDTIKAAIAGSVSSVWGSFSKRAEEMEAEEDRKAEERAAKEAK